MNTFIKKVLLCFLLPQIITISLISEEIITLSTGEWSPYTSKDNPTKSIAETIIREAFRNENIKVSVKYYPWKRAYKVAKELDSDGTFPWLGTEKRFEDFYSSEQAIIKIKMVFFHLKNFQFKWNSYSDLKKYRIGGTIGYKSAELLKEKNLTVELVPREVQNFKKLLKNRIDITPSSYLVGYDIINNNFSKKEKLAFTNHPKKVYPDTGAYLLISKKHPNAKELINKFNKGLDKLIESGRYKKIIDNFLLNTN